MQNEHDPFELFEPPPGGVERLRSKLEEPPQARVGLGLAALGVAAVAALVALVVLLPRGPEAPAVTANAMLAAPQLDRLLGRESQPLPLEVERGGQPVPTEELPSADPSVRIYRVL